MGTVTICNLPKMDSTKQCLPLFLLLLMTSSINCKPVIVITGPALAAIAGAAGAVGSAAVAPAVLLGKALVGSGFLLGASLANLGDNKLGFLGLIYQLPIDSLCLLFISHIFH